MALVSIAYFMVGTEGLVKFTQVRFIVVNIAHWLTRSEMKLIISYAIQY